MRGLVKFRSKKYNAQPKQVDGTANAWVRLDLMPGRLHFRAPIDVIQHHPTVVVYTFKDLIEIPKGGLQPVISIQPSHAHRLHVGKCGSKRLVHISLDQSDILQSIPSKTLLCLTRDEWIPFQCVNSLRRSRQRQILSCDPKRGPQLQHRTGLILM